MTSIAIKAILSRPISRDFTTMPAALDKDHSPLEGDHLAAHIEQVLRVQPPAGWEQRLTYSAIKRMFKPQVVGAERLSDKPCLFIGNHSLFALDGMLMAPLMLEEYDRFLRPLGDKFLFTNEAVARGLIRRGASMGHPEICKALMRDGQDILVFPGGAHEAVKPASAMYQLQWKERFGFVKLAAECGYTIQPFGLVGPDEFYGHLIEGQELPESPLGRVLGMAGLIDDSTRPDLLPPVPVGAMGTLIPKPKPCFLGFGETVDLSQCKGKKLSKNQLAKIRQQVAAQIETQISQLLLLREQSRSKDGLLRRLLTL